MVEKIKIFIDQKSVRQLADPRNVVLYIFTVILLAISWSTVKTIQSNYQLQKKISLLNQQNAVLKLENENADLKNKYLSTDEYLDLAARQSLGLAAPGEKVLLISKNVALKHVDQKLINQAVQPGTVDNRPKLVKNLDDWKDFLLGRKLFSDQ